MALLFPIVVDPEDVPAIPGLSYRAGYLSDQEEMELAQNIDAAPWDTSWERRRQPYGWSYGKQSGPPRPIPAWGLELAERLLNDGISDRCFDQMLVNEYLPGQGIALHFDYSPFDRTVASISLLSPCVMDFRQPTAGEQHSLLLERRSLLVLSDQARYEWQHGIARRKNDRWHGVLIPRARRLSITFRLAKSSATGESISVARRPDESCDRSL
jgi:alkylated DNA repair dioxygenase AlkB